MAGQRGARGIRRSEILKAGGGQSGARSAARQAGGGRQSFSGGGRRGASCGERQGQLGGKKERYLVALDIGSAKTCALIAEIEDGGARFLGMGAAESKGSRKGLIVNLDAAVSSIRRALEEAEGVANVPVESAVVGVAGSHVRGVNSRGGISLGSRARDIEREDVRKAVDAARAITLSEDRDVLHV